MTHKQRLEAETAAVREGFAVSILRWFDADAGGPGRPGDDDARRVDWVRCLPFFALHLACFAVIWTGWSWVAVSVALLLYAFRMFAITGFYHRYFSHRSFKTSRIAQLVFAVLGNTAAQRGPLWWAAQHRHHHRHSDEEQDPHSPEHHSFLWSHALWLTAPANFRTRLEFVKDLARFPELRFLDRFDALVPFFFFAALFGFGALLSAVAPGLGTSGAQMLVWGIISTVVPFHGSCTINSLAHRFGKRRFATRDSSRNSFLLALLTLGEGWHNNHHHYPASVRQGFYWWELDLTYYGLKLLASLGIIWDLKPVPRRALKSRLTETLPAETLEGAHS
jgi:stearoyl-CoA desaturase (delta-9 desaturase)